MMIDVNEAFRLFIGVYGWVLVVVSVSLLVAQVAPISNKRTRRVALALYLATVLIGLILMLTR